MARKQVHRKRKPKQIESDRIADLEQQLQHWIQKADENQGDINQLLSNEQHYRRRISELESALEKSLSDANVQRLKLAIAAKRLAQHLGPQLPDEIKNNVAFTDHAWKV